MPSSPRSCWPPAAASIGVDLAAAPSVLAGYDAYTHVAGSVTDEQLWAGVTASLPAAGSLGLVTNAAILHVGDILTQPMDQVRQTLDVNIVGTVMAMRAVIPAMVARGGGSVVSVASIDAHFAEQQLAAYCASKSAVLQLARTVALDQARAGVNVNVVCPGPMRAGLFERHLASADDSDGVPAHPRAAAAVRRDPRPGAGRRRHPVPAVGRRPGDDRRQRDDRRRPHHRVRLPDRRRGHLGPGAGRLPVVTIAPADGALPTGTIDRRLVASCWTWAGNARPAWPDERSPHDLATRLAAITGTGWHGVGLVYADLVEIRDDDRPGRPRAG